MASVPEMLERMHECAAIITDPMGRASAGEKKRAQDVFIEFQKTKNPFGLCKELLENTNDQYVLYQIGSCLKNGVIRDWENLGTEAGKQLFEYLFEYCHRKPLDHYVIAELMFIVALIIKRIIFYESRLHQDRELIERLCQCMKTVSLSPVIRMNAAIAINLLLTELSSASHTDFAASWYTQLTTKIYFEKHRLRTIYESLIETLFEHLKLPAEQLRGGDSGKFLFKVITNCEVVLTWNFSSNLETIMLGLNANFFAYRSERFERFHPPQDWMHLIVEGNVGFFFDVYLAIRSFGNEDLIYKTMICLTQLSSFTASDKFFCKPIRSRYVENFIQSILRLISSIYEQLSLQELAFFSNIINNICAHFRTQCIIRYLNYDLVRQFLDVVSKMTCKVMQTSVQKSNDDEQNEHYTLTISHLTNSWMIASMSIQMVQSIAKSGEENFAGFITEQELQDWTRLIVDDYIRCHISQPEGFLSIESYNDDDDDVINEFEENDNEKFKEQLTTIGELANINIEHSIETLNKLLLIKLQQFEMIVSTQNVSNDEKTKAWIQVCENIHWILMISTYVLHNTEDCDIPHNITLLCNDKRWDLSRTQHSLQNVDINQIDGVDPIIKFLMSIIKLINMEEYLLKNGGNLWISPQVSLTLSIFVARFMNSYLMPVNYDLEDEDYVESVLNSVLDKHSDTANHLLGFFIDHMANKFLYMNSENEVLNITALGLSKFSRNKDRMNALKKNNTLKVLAQRFGDNAFKNCSSILRKIMYQLFISVYCDDLEFILRPLIEQYKKFCNELNNSGNKEEIRNLFITIADCSIGLANGVSAKASAECWNSYHLHVYSDLPHIMVEMHNYSNVVHSILNMMLQFSVMFAPFFTQDESIHFYDLSLSILKEYAKYNNGKASSDMLRIEELEEEFICILRFLQEISNRDIFYFDILPSNSPSSLTEVINNVIFTSIHILLPVMRHEMLQNEKLCSLYYKLLEALAADSDRFRSFPRDLFNSLIQSVHYAFKGTNVSTDVKCTSFKIITELCDQVLREPEKNNEILIFLESFFQNIFEFIFQDLNYNSEKVVMNLVATALYMLICCFPDSYQDRIRTSMNIHDNPDVQIRIQSKLFEIIDEVGMDCSVNQNRLRFKTRFPDFVKLIIKELSLR